MKALIELMAKSLVDKPEEVAVAQVDGEKPLFLNCVLLQVILERLSEGREIQHEQ